MSYYPQIDYIGAMSKIADQWQDIPRVDREMEDRTMKRNLYDLQLKKYQLEADKEQRALDYEKGLGEYYRANMADTEPTTSELAIPKDYRGDTYSSIDLGEEKVSITRPPKKSLYQLGAEHSFNVGRVAEALKFSEMEQKAQEEARKAKEAQTKEFRDSVKWLADIYDKSPTWGKNLQKQMAAQGNKVASALGDFITDPAGETVAVEMKNKAGDIVAYVNPKNPKDAKWIVKAPTDANSVLELEMERANPETSPERVKFIDSVLEAHTKREIKKAREGFVDTRNPYQASPYTDENGNPLAFDPKANTLVPVKVPGKVKKMGTESAKKEKKGLDELSVKGSKKTDLSKKPWGKWAQ